VNWLLFPLQSLCFHSQLAVGVDAEEVFSVDSGKSGVVGHLKLHHPSSFPKPTVTKEHTLSTLAICLMCVICTKFVQFITVL